MNALFALVLIAAVGVLAYRLVFERSGIAFWAEFAVVYHSVFYGIFFFLGLISILFGIGFVSLLAAVVVIVILITGYEASARVREPIVTAATQHQSPTFLAYSYSGGTYSWNVARLSIFGTLLVSVLLVAMALFGYPTGFEAGAYHVPLGIEFFRNQSLLSYAASGIPQDAGYTFTYPANSSIWYGFLLQWLPERLVGIGQYPFLFLLALAVYGICQVLGADRAASAIITCALFSIPMLAFGSLVLGSDVAALAFAGLAVYFAARFPLMGNRMLCLSGLAAGLAFGFKALHINTIAILGAYVLWATWKDNAAKARRKTGQRMIVVAVIFAGSALLTAGFWIVRNWVFHGSPLYPVHLGGIFDVLGFARTWDYNFADVSSSEYEWVKSSLRWFLYPWEEWHYINQSFKSSAGTGAYFAAVILPTSLVAAVLSLKRGGHRLVRILLVGAILSLVLWAIEGVRQPRYALTVLVFLFPVSAWLISCTRGRARWLLDIVGLCAISLMLFMVLSKELVQFGDRIVYSGLMSRHGFYEYPAQLDYLPAGSVVLNLASRARNYSLYGEGLDNRIVPYQEAMGRIVEAVRKPQGESGPRLVLLRSDQLQLRGVTHVYIEADATLQADKCLRVAEQARMDRNPLNNVPLPNPRILFVVTECKASGAD